MNMNRLKATGKVVFQHFLRVSDSRTHEVCFFPLLNREYQITTVFALHFHYA